MINANVFDIILMMTMLLMMMLYCFGEITAMGFDEFPSHHDITKRMDLEICLDRFDVHQNTIIRTEESRSMGAKFLDDADLSSREQCRRLCCETENCDVFVFEEKNQGTCFLFQCGPPTDFHCKFTHHFNYTSAVLKIPTVDQSSPPLVSQIHSLAQVPPVSIVPKLSQHELELVNLKAPKTSTPSTTTTLLPPLGVQLGRFSQSTSTTSKPSTTVPCRLYEFACHSGECIAVYNACDGIPQCADGSDEGPECRRPGPTKNFQTPQSQQQQLPLLQQQNLLNGLSLQKPLMPPIYQPDVQQQQLRGLQQQQQDQAKIIHNREDPMTAPRSWTKPLNDPQQPAYIDPTDSRIFSHKGGLQLASANSMVVPQYQDTLPDTSYVPNIPRNNAYMQIPFNYQSGAPQMGPPQRAMWPPQQTQLPQEQYVQPPLQHQPDLIQQQNPQLIQQTQQAPPLQVQSQQQQKTPQTQLQPTPSTQSKPVEPPAQEPQQAKKPPKESPQKSSEEYDTYDEHEYQDGGHQQQSSNSGEDQQQQQPEEKPDPPKKTKQHKHRKQQHGDEHEKKRKKPKAGSVKKDRSGEHAAMPPVHEHLKMMRNDLEIEFADHDGQAERPGGAVLSLTLGAILTAALAILIGCRMKVARRRIRRQGKSSYAHDADFLVNGMYL
ncbi:transcription factor SPT20 homolog [Uranotaenia lowii]|uniref:transcription factor SPT20 homolog n=1 Tax=Uranotaenia lowii TaxID=190385 RepID=UPI00247A735D|nr:transcription factor SPT20 homolog [Uranotaenia lowii]